MSRLATFVFHFPTRKEKSGCKSRFISTFILLNALPGHLISTQSGN